MEPEQWVYIDDLACLKYNGRFGQILGTAQSRDGKTKRYAVAVDGIPGNRTCVELHVRIEPSKKVALPAKHLVKVRPTVRAVRLHAEGEDNENMQGITYIQNGNGLQKCTHAVSEVYLPAGLMRFSGGPGECNVMRRAGLPLALHEVAERRRLPRCRADGGLQCYMATHFRHDESNHWAWCDWAGPHVVSTVDGTDLLINDLKLYWYFVVYVRDGYGMEVEDFEEQFGRSPQQAVTPQIFDEFRTKAEVHVRQGTRFELGWLRIEAESASSDQADRHAVDGPNSVVMDSIEHMDPPAVIHEYEAAQISAMQHAGHIEQNCGIAPSEVGNTAFAMDVFESPRLPPSIGSRESATHDATPMDPEKVHILRFGSAPSGGDSFQRFYDAVLQGPQLKQCRQALESAGHSVVLPERTLVFVKPEQYFNVRRELVGRALTFFHMIITESLEYLIDEVLSNIPYKRRPRVKADSIGRTEIVVAQSSQDSSDCTPDEDGPPAQDTEQPDDQEEENNPMVIVEKRTFLGEYPELRPAHTVVQSTTEALVGHSETHYSNNRGVNPRRTV